MQSDAGDAEEVEEVASGAGGCGVAVEQCGCGPLDGCGRVGGIVVGKAVDLAERELIRGADEVHAVPGCRHVSATEQVNHVDGYLHARDGEKSGGTSGEEGDTAHVRMQRAHEGVRGDGDVVGAGTPLAVEPWVECAVFQARPGRRIPSRHDHVFRVCLASGSGYVHAVLLWAYPEEGRRGWDGA